LYKVTNIFPEEENNYRPSGMGDKTLYNAHMQMIKEQDMQLDLNMESNVM
jgi:hypothetical protein